MLIDITNEITFSAKLGETIYEWFAALDDNTSNAIREQVIESNTSVDCIVGEYVTESNALSLYSDVISVLKTCSFVCYHATRVLNVKEIENQGLHVNDWDQYSASLIRSLKALEISESDIDSLMIKVKKEYKRKYTDRNRNPQICFFTRIDLQNHYNCSPEYLPFLTNIGGELVRWSLNNNSELQKIYQNLYTFGQTIIVKVDLPFKDLANEIHTRVAEQFIRFYIAKYCWNYPYKINFDCYTEKDITTKQIIDIIPITVQ